MSSVPVPRLAGGRLAYERAIRRSSLPAPARHLALTIATWADIETGVIPERFQPSISTLAEATGLSTATVKRHLGVLEEEEWVARERPDIDQARREHARTQYALHIPAGLAEHGSERAMPRVTVSQGHGSERARAGLTVSHKSPPSTEESPPPPTPSPSAGPSRVLEGGGGGSPAGNDKHLEAVAFLRGLPAPWTAGKTTAERLAPLLLEHAADNGWHLDDQLAAKLTENPGGINNYPAVLRRRLEDLPRRDVPRPRSAGSSSSLPPWCEKCGDGNKSARREATYRVFIDDNGFAKKCPACHPDALAARAAA